MPSKAFKTFVATALIAGTCFGSITPAFAFGFGGVHADDPAPVDPAPWVPWQPQTNPTSGWIPPTDVPWTPSDSLGMGGPAGSDPVPAAAAPTTPEPFEPAKLTVEKAKTWTGDDVAKLTPAQVAAIPAASLAAISPEAFIKFNVLTIRAIPAANIPALPVSDFARLPWQVTEVMTPEQIGAVTASQLKYFNVDSLPPQNVKYISPAAISAQDPGFFSELPIYQSVWFSQEQAQKVSIATIHALNVNNDAAMVVALKAYFSGGDNVVAAKDKLDEFKVKFGSGALQQLVQQAIFWYDVQSAH
jgi:hypothetical protein